MDLVSKQHMFNYDNVREKIEMDEIKDFVEQVVNDAEQDAELFENQNPSSSESG